MRIVAFMRELVAKGMSWDDAAIMAERFEESLEDAVAKVAPVRTAGATRQAAYRERKRNAEHNAERNVVDNRRDGPEGAARATCTYAQVVTPSLSSLPSEVQKEVGGGGGECERAPAFDDWPKPIPAWSHQLVEAVASPRLDPNKSLGLNTTAGRLAAWKAAGASWEHDVLPVVTALCAKQRTPISTWKFFDNAIGRSIADNRAALEIPAAGAVRATGPPGSSLAAQIAAEHAEARRRVLES
jgi:hypothetical protein